MKCMVDIQLLIIDLFKDLSTAAHCVLTSPMTRPDFPRINSTLSGFFFCGIKLLPVLYNTKYHQNAALKNTSDLLKNFQLCCWLCLWFKPQFPDKNKIFNLYARRSLGLSITFSQWTFPLLHEI